MRLSPAGLLVLLTPLPVLAAGGGVRPPPRFTATEIFSFPPSNPVFIENLLVLPDDCILLSNFVSFSPPKIGAAVHVLDPSTSPPAVQVIATLVNATSQTGLAKLPSSPPGSGSSANKRYAIAAGILGDNFEFVNNTAAIYILDFASTTAATVEDVIPVPGVLNLNGLVSLPFPGRQHILLAADSRGGRIIKIDTDTKQASVAFSDVLMSGDPENVEGSLGITGVNGLYITQAGWLYFTNTARGLLGKVKVDGNGNKVGAVQVVREITSPQQQPIGFANALDDLIVDRKGDAYIAWQDASLVRVYRENRFGGTTGQEIILGPGGVSGDNEGIVLKTPTAVALGNSGKEIYVATGGIDGGNLTGGQVVRVSI
ncbi:hypothetical protein QBC35DRAFT_486833 [Podospora australis]|uniref:SMP-30/Gluconolactonase/LRE-like region domain-containing protein n=1 Tax=Podospora australis TaxID=1536484 RepID=A0AAN6X0A8_9PEZI|nr:hypothetical protein QBC35DRAFT_486833 [Podospora australis]